MKQLTGMCVSVGEAEGILKKYEEGVEYTKNDIVVVDVWVTKNVALLKNAGAVLSSKGGLTCHASIIAREFGIPGLVSVKGISEIPEGTKIKVDSASEEVIIL